MKTKPPQSSMCDCCEKVLPLIKEELLQLRSMLQSMNEETKPPVAVEVIEPTMKHILITNYNSSYRYLYNEKHKRFTSVPKKEDGYDELFVRAIFGIVGIYESIPSAVKIDTATKQFIQQFLDRTFGKDCSYVRFKVFYCIYPNDEDGVAIWLEADDQPPLPEL